jgi:hypothetical protein
MHRIARIACAVSAIIVIALMIGNGMAARRAHERWEADLPYDEIASREPVTLTLPQIALRPPETCRRVRLAGSWIVNDIMKTPRPVVLSDGRTHLLEEGLVFLRDSLTDMRMVLLTRLDREPPNWVELMPLPSDPLRSSTIGRLTSLAHLAKMWDARWAESNGPGRLVWLGLDSSIVRNRDVENLTPPYRLRPRPRLGTPGSIPEPTVWTPLMFMMGTVALLLALIAALGTTQKTEK